MVTSTLYNKEKIHEDCMDIRNTVIGWVDIFYSIEYFTKHRTRYLTEAQEYLTLVKDRYDVYSGFVPHATMYETMLVGFCTMFIDHLRQQLRKHKVRWYQIGSVRSEIRLYRKGIEATIELLISRQETYKRYLARYEESGDKN